MSTCHGNSNFDFDTNWIGLFTFKEPILNVNDMLQYLNNFEAAEVFGGTSFSGKRPLTYSFSKSCKV